MATNTKLDSLVINYLTQSQYDSAKSAGTLNSNQIYMTPATTSTYTLPTATSSTLGGVKIGSNITVSSGTISISKTNVTNALGYTPPTTDTKYTLPTASSSTLGGVKLSDSTSTTSGVSNGVAATPTAVKAAYDAAIGWTDFTLSVFNYFTLSSSVSGSLGIFFRGHRIFLTIKGSGSATAGASGLINIGTVASGYRPDINMFCAVPINMSSTGQVFGSATCEIKTTGAVNIMVGSANKVCGNNSYPWCTASGMTIVWDYK